MLNKYALTYLMASPKIHTAKHMQPIFKKLNAEFIGTFALVFAGTGAVVINDVSGGSITHAGIALTFGLVVLAMIYAVGDISGAHFNPAVTSAFWLAGRLPAGLVLPYVASQCLGALSASFVLHFLFPAHDTLGCTLPADSDSQSFVLELILTSILMFVILNVSTGAKEKGITAGIAVGAVIGLEAMFAGPICGASMNPARSLAPALVSGHLEHLWIYLTAPFAGAWLAIVACRGCQDAACCPLPFKNKN
jgi:aquaporin Z